MISINITDEYGKLYTDPYNQVILTLKGDRKKIIGRLYDDNGTIIYKKEEKRKDIFRMNNSWSLCNYVLRELKDTDIVNIHTREDYKTYWLTVKDCKEKGDFLWFKTSGTEKKIYVPLEAWNIG